MGELAKQRDFAEGRGGDALVFDFKADAFEGDDFVGLTVAGFVDYAVGSFAEVGTGLFDLLVAVDDD